MEWIVINVFCTEKMLLGGCFGLNDLKEWCRMDDFD
jgi:hypothetical protein